MTFDPYHKWLGIPKDQRPPTHYQLLGLAHGESDPEVIEEAAIRQTSHLRAYQIGAYAAECTRILNEVAKARTTLLDPVKRAQYDRQIAPSSTAVTAEPPVVVSPFDQLDSASGKAKLVSVQRKPIGGAGLWIGLGAAAVVLIAAVIGSVIVFTKDTPIVIVQEPEENPQPRPVPPEEQPKPPDEQPRPPEKPKPPDEKKPPIENPLPLPEPIVEITPGEVYRNGRDTNFFRFSPDGRHVFFQQPRGVTMWNVAENKEVRVFPLGAPVTAYAGAVSPNGRRVAVYTGNRAALVWDVNTGNLMRALPQAHSISALAFSPDSQVLAVASGLGKQDNTVQLWHINTGKLVQKFDDFAQAPNVIALDDSTLYAIDAMRILYRCNLQTGAIDSKKQLNTYSPYVRFTADLRQMGYLKAGRVAVFDLQDDKEVRGAELPADARPYANGLHLSADGRMAVVSLANGNNLVFLDLMKGTPVKTLEGHQKPLRSAALAPDGTRAFSMDQDRMIRIWKLDGEAAQVAALKPDPKPETPGLKPPESMPEQKPEAKFVGKLDPKFIPAWESIKCPSYSALAITPDGKKAVTAGPGLDVWDLATGKLWKKLQDGAGDSPFGSVALSPDGTHALAISGDNMVRRWDLAAGRMVRSHIYGSRPNCVAWSASGQVAAVGGRFLYVIDPETLETKRPIAGFQEGDVLAVAFSPDGGQIVFGHEGGAVRVTPTIASGARTVYTHTQGTAVHGIAVTSNLIMSGGVDKRFYFWDINRGRGQPFDAKTAVRTLVASPRGTYALTGGDDMKIRLWQTRTARTVHTCTGHEAAVRAVAFAPNGQFFVSTSEVGTLRVWKLPKEVVGAK
ncbi:MAG: WD40 repeat domain-containing protein [Gemmataceae bacterium]|nr:WD40 repeat domain-containing protein [Gemmataceae bacterium]